MLPIIPFIIPVIVTFFVFLLKSASGPYWQFPDPSYGYLSSGLSLFKGFSPTFNYQPGTSVEMLGGLTIFLLNIGHSTSDAVRRVLLDPDFYLNAINTVMVVFVFLTSSILGVYVYRQTNDKLAVLLSQLPVLSFLALRSYSFYDYVLPVITNVSPEPLLISVAALFNLCFLKLFFAKEHREEMLMTILLGVICALGIATRLTFSPYLMIPLIVCKGRMKFLFLAVSAVSLFLWTIPIIPSYGWVGGWITRLLTHTGEYGSGTQGFINLSLFLLNCNIILSKCWYLMLFGLGALILSLGQIIKNPMSRGTSFFLATAFCVLVQLAIIAKHYDDHYLVAAISLFSPLFVLAYVNVKNKNIFLKATVFLCIIVFIVQSLGNALAYSKQLSGYTKAAVSFNNMIHEKYADFIFVGVFPMPMSTSEAAFFWGNDRDNRQQDELANLYPKRLAYFLTNMNDYAPYVSGIYSIKQRVWADDLITSGARVMFVAPKGYDFSQTPYTVLPLEQGKYAASYLLVASTEKQAEMLFDAAIKLLEAGDYPQAFVLALKSKQLHYQPAGKVDYLLSVIYPRIKH